MLYLSFKFVGKFKFCVSPLVKRYPGLRFSLMKTGKEICTKIKLLKTCFSMKLSTIMMKDAFP